MKVHRNGTRCRKPQWLFTALLSAGIGLSSIGGIWPALANDGNDGGEFEVVEPGRTLFGKSYNQLAGAWANWLQREPPESNPAFDPDGRFCHLNQRGKIWYLAGTFEGVTDRVCQVPAGRGIFFPIFSFVSFAPEFPDEPPCDVLAEQVDQVRCDVNDDIAVAPFVALEVTVDGKDVADLFGYRVQSQPGGFTFRLGPLFAAFGFEPGDRFPAVVDGYWILLKPLRPGLHTVTFSADFNIDGTPDLGANYNLLIVDDGDEDTQ